MRWRVCMAACARACIVGSTRALFGCRCAAAGLPLFRPDDYFAEMIKTDAHMAKVKNKLLQAKAEQTAIEERQKQRYPTSRLFRISANPVGRVWQHGVSGMRRSSGRRCKWRRSRSARRSSLADSVQIHQKFPDRQRKRVHWPLPAFDSTVACRSAGEDEAHGCA